MPVPRPRGSSTGWQSGAPAWHTRMFSTSASGAMASGTVSRTRRLVWGSVTAGVARAAVGTRPEAARIILGLEEKRDRMAYEDAHHTRLRPLGIGQLVYQDAVALARGDGGACDADDANDVLAARLKGADRRARHDVPGWGEDVLAV